MRNQENAPSQPSLKVKSDKPDMVVMERTPIKGQSRFGQFGKDEDEEEASDEENSPVKRAIAPAAEVLIQLGTPRQSSIASVKEMGKRFDLGEPMIPKSSLGFVSAIIDPLESQKLKEIGKSVYESLAAETFGSPKAEEKTRLRNDEEILASILCENAASEIDVETVEGNFDLPYLSEAIPEVESRSAGRFTFFWFMAFLGLAVTFLASSDLSISQQVIVEWDSALVAAPLLLESAKSQIKDSTEWVKASAKNSWAEIVTNSVALADFMQAQSSPSYTWILLEEEYKSYVLESFETMKEFMNELNTFSRVQFGNVKSYMVELYSLGIEKMSELYDLGIEKMIELKDQETVDSVISTSSRVGNEVYTMVSDLNIPLEWFLISLASIFLTMTFVYRSIGVRGNADLVYVCLNSYTVE
jgi:hypothetical protein